MTTIAGQQPSKKKTIVVFVFTIVGGFILFALPNIFLGITKFNGGLKGINLLFMGLFQAITIITLMYFSLKTLKKDFAYIGFTNKKLTADLLWEFSLDYVGPPYNLFGLSLIQAEHKEKTLSR